MDEQKALQVVRELIASGQVTDPDSARGKLLQTAAHLFRNKGYERTTVRDLASGYQLAWHPTRTATAEETLPILLSLFDEQGLPLVLKSDNGSAFKSRLLAGMLDDWQIVPLRSPPAK